MLISHLCGMIVGSLAITLLLYSILKWVLHKCGLGFISAKIVSGLLAAAVLVSLASIKMGPGGVLIYAAAATFWLAIDLLRKEPASIAKGCAQKMDKSSEESWTQQFPPPLDRTPPSNAPSNYPQPVQISGFWRRLLAAFIDIAVLGAMGWLLGAFFFSTLVQLGPWGLPLGFVIALLYYGVLNSGFCDGQTIGKAIMKIRVVDAQGQGLTFFRSCLRFVILGIPYYLNGAPIPFHFAQSPLGTLIGLLIYILGLPIVYLFIFNRRTRQSLHDLIAGSFVIRAASAGQAIDRRIWRGHFIVVAVLLFTTLAASYVLKPVVSKNPLMADALTTQSRIADLDNVWTASVFYLNKSSLVTGRTVKCLQVEAFLKKPPQDNDKAINQVAAAIFATYPRIMELDQMEVRITHGYNIGIAQGWLWYRGCFPPAQWKARLK